MEKRLKIHWWNGAVVGHLIHKGAIYFVYDEEWIKLGHNLSPLSLPFGDVAFNGNKGIDGLPGLIADCLPDQWGRKVARKIFASHKWGEPTTMMLLAWRGTRGLGALHFLPDLHEIQSGDKLNSISAASLARGAGEIERGEPTEVLKELSQGGSAGGAYPKVLVLFYPDGTLKVGQPDGVGVPSLLKLSIEKGKDNSLCEHAYALMAKASGIRAVETRLIDGDPIDKRQHLLVTRFDVADAQHPKRRFHFHSLSGILHKAPGDLEYRDLFRVAIRIHTPQEELREIARRMIFNVLSSNHDDHGKNHAFLYDEDRREWSLTPAYDMNYSQGMLERGMLVSGEVWPTAQTMMEICLSAGIRKDEIWKLFDEVKAGIDQWPDLADKTGVSKAISSEIHERHMLLRSRVFA